jgi:hypothetical protein
MQPGKSRRRVERSATAFTTMGVIRNPPLMSLHVLNKWLGALFSVRSAPPIAPAMANTGSDRRSPPMPTAHAFCHSTASSECGTANRIHSACPSVLSV